MDHMVRMKHSDDRRSNILFIEWHLGNFCNYSCSYCPPGLHSGTAPWVPVEVISRVVCRFSEIAQARGQSCHFDFSGGEVTLIPSFDALLRTVREAGCMVSFISNGARQLDWWRSVLDCLTAVTLSFHVERASVDHFIRVAGLLSQSVRVHANIAMLPELRPSCGRAASSKSSNSLERGKLRDARCQE